MRISVLCVGGVKGAVASVVSDYETRAGRYWRLRIEEVEGGLKRGKKSDPTSVKDAEAHRLWPQLPERGEIVALTRSGKALGSRELAAYLQEQALRSVPEVAFVIGGAYGLGSRILDRATAKISLSTLTLPHELARLLLAEQLYRAGTISKNEPYHKGP